MAKSEAWNMLTVAVHLNIDLNGEPITRVLNMPASMAPIGSVHDGLHIYLDLDGRKLAEALLPHIAPLIHVKGRVRYDAE